LLCVLLLRFCAMPANAGGAWGHTFLLRCAAIVMTKTSTANDWLGRTHTHLIAWLFPQAAIALGLLLDVPWRTAVWSIALVWMGVACMVNARRCSRTHCRYTGHITSR
jgi:hypothetical protein